MSHLIFNKRNLCFVDKIPFQDNCSKASFYILSIMRENHETIWNMHCLRFWRKIIWKIARKKKLWGEDFSSKYKILFIWRTKKMQNLPKMYRKRVLEGLNELFKSLQCYNNTFKIKDVWIINIIYKVTILNMVRNLFLFFCLPSSWMQP